jgi:enamine deaminase RidA (YjgF/YER057c/UK114 family)
MIAHRAVETRRRTSMAHVRIDATPASGAGDHPHSSVVMSTAARQVHIAGTVGCTPTRELVDDMGLQAERALASLERSLTEVGATADDVVRVTVYTTDLERYREEAVPPLSRFLTRAKPALTLLQVPRLADPDYLIEVEATAVLGGDPGVAPPPSLAHMRTNPFGLYPPAKNAYSQIVVSHGTRQIHVAALSGRRADGSMPSTMREQATAIVANLDAALAEGDATRSDVVRITTYVTDMPEFRSEAGEIVFGAFSPDKPASTLLAVAGLADPEAHVELQATAVVQDAVERDPGR